LNPPLTIVAYHYVRDLERTRYPRIKGRTVRDFAGQLDYLRLHHRFVSMADCVAALRGGPALPAGAALLTFDDGYLDHFTQVLPLLAARGIQGSFFPPARAVVERRVLDVNKIHFVLASVEDVSELLPRVFTLLDELREEFGLESREAYFERLAVPSRWDTREVKFVKNLLQHGLPPAARERILGALFQEHVAEDEACFARELYMDEDQLRCLRHYGMHVGSHGHDHLHFATLPPAEQRKEVDRSVAFLNGLGVPPDEWTMCYPHGSHDESIARILAETGFQLALTTAVGLAELSAENAFVLARLDTNDLPVDAAAPPGEWTRRALA
jgi:peptidoglycan/xylan/chitin deacetylase (PgdA/CDA1 family)